MQTFPSTDLKFLYSHLHDPIGTVAPGERFHVETEDCFTGRFRTPEGFTTENLDWVLRNLDGVTGPISVQGARPGDVVAITIEDIEITTPGTVVLSRCADPSPEDWWGEWYAAKAYDIVDGELVFDGRRRIPVRPLIGCIATAPEREVLLSKMQGSYGGNMDCNAITTGATVYLPVEVDGAYLYFGDCKALMGDGEIVQPPEVGTNLTVRVEVAARPEEMSWPRVADAERLTTVVSDIDVGHAGALAFKELMAWVEREYGLSRDETVALLGMVAHVGVAQTANTLHTATCSVERRYLA